MKIFWRTFQGLLKTPSTVNSEIMEKNYIGCREIVFRPVGHFLSHLVYVT